MNSARLMTVAFSDGLGDRLRTTDSTGRAVEVLRLNPELLEIPSFEIALRERAARLSAFRDPAFVPVLRIDQVGHRPHTLAIVSERVMGRRLSGVLAEVEAGRAKLPPDRAMAWLRQIIAAVARLHAYAHDAEHGALSPERLIVNESGDIVVGEYVLGEAIEALHWPRQLLWRRLRVAMPPSAGLSRVDQRADLVQIGTIALALTIGRPLRDADYPDALPAILREASRCVARVQPSLAAGMAGWMVRALQHEYRSFGSVREALTVLDDLMAGVLPQVGSAAQTSVARVRSPHVLPVRRLEPVEKAQPPHTPRPQVSRPAAMPVERPGRAAQWVLARRVALILLAMAFSTSIGASHYRAPDATNGERSGSDRSPVTAREPATTSVVRPAAELPASADALLDAGILLPPGWIEFSAPVDMKFLEGGATIAEGRGGRLAAKSGLHNIEVVNRTLGFRETRHITVRPGGITRVVVQLPFGIVDLNATPWAEVWLDGQRVGETPIGNLSVPIGPHEVVFRHPQFGERRHAVSLTTAAPVRLSVDMTRQ